MASRYAEASDPAELAAVIRSRQAGRPLLLLLDYDGTLTPLVENPDNAAPDEELLTLLTMLARTPRFEPHVVSGRTRETLERWLGALPIGLHAEHGAYSRAAAAASAWNAHATASMDQTIDIARSVIGPYMVEGALLEAKELGLAWHYRAVERRVGARQALLLSRRLRAVLRGTPLTIIRGSRVLEVRPRGVTKGQLAASLAESAPSLVVAIGDDRTDEDMFLALGDSAVTIHVGGGGSHAGWRLGSVSAVRALLLDLATRARAPV